ncbi:helix-turn-helix transcriptional regulator [Candidatus Parcubacteria bacterium]|nr:helix-turn-helix transcriptional regulator [Patescibacteria group bacterium]MCG2689657.1 helix-turn-helix transcriptional regulator [Candidatus Parcubacteria bacterium]
MLITKSKNISKIFGKNLKKLRVEKQMSQGDIARALGVHRSYISGLERGVRNPTLINIERIARAMGAEIRKLLE